ncbi:hypothetical protein BB561_006039 [Smittium simulii]|uniref:Uncharacterized protein n=1 Tax=Smittium simulii TaxID=133385 RepID=A0A2T9Y6W4_9FUNG|nr:hypothetical protein BB561_006039 [Smittium simulii]
MRHRTVTCNGIFYFWQRVPLGCTMVVVHKKSKEVYVSHLVSWNQSRSVASLTRTRLLDTLLGGELVITTAGLHQLQSSTPAASNVVSMVRYMPQSLHHAQLFSTR